MFRQVISRAGRHTGPTACAGALIAFAAGMTGTEFQPNEQQSITNRYVLGRNRFCFGNAITTSCEKPTSVSRKLNDICFQFCFFMNNLGMGNEEEDDDLPPFQEEETYASGDGESATAGLIQTILRMILPIARKALSKKMMETGMVLYNEEPLPPIYDSQNLPLQPLLVTVENVRTVNSFRLYEDMKNYPDFVWPQRKRIEEFIHKQKSNTTTPTKNRIKQFMNKKKRNVMDPTKNYGDEEEDTGMLVVDVENLDITLALAKGIEITFPVEKKGMKMDIEIGSGGAIDAAWIRMEVPRIRIWYIHESKTIYLSILEPPNITPYLHVNGDRGKGDFFGISITEKGEFDNILEQIIAGFGPSTLGTTQPTTNYRRGSSSWVADLLADKILDLLSIYTPVKPGRPLELDLKDTIEEQIRLYQRNAKKPKTKSNL